MLTIEIGKVKLGLKIPSPINFLCIVLAKLTEIYILKINLYKV